MSRPRKGLGEVAVSLFGDGVHRGMVALGIPAVAGLLAWGGVQLYEIKSALTGTTKTMEAMEKRMDKADKLNDLFADRILRRVERLDGQIIDLERRKSNN